MIRLFGRVEEMSMKATRVDQLDQKKNKAFVRIRTLYYVHKSDFLLL